MQKLKLVFVLLLMSIFLKSFAQKEIILEIDTCSYKTLNGYSIAIKAKITNKTINNIIVASPSKNQHNVGVGSQYTWDVSFIRDDVRYVFENDNYNDMFGYISKVTIKPYSDYTFKLFIDPNKLRPKSVFQNYNVQISVKIDQPNIIIYSNSISVNYKSKK